MLFYQPALLRGEPGRDPRGLARRHVVPRRPARRGRGRRRLQPAERARDPAASATRWRRRRRSGSSSGGSPTSSTPSSGAGRRPRPGRWSFPARRRRPARPAGSGPAPGIRRSSTRRGSRGSCSSPSSRSRSARGALARPGRVFGLFLIGYGLARIIVERFRQADAQFVTAGNPHGHVLAARRRLGPDHGPAPDAADAGGGRDPHRAGGAAGVTRARGADPPRASPQAGPMRLDAYMALCLGHPQHGYYATRDPLGRGRRLRHRARGQPDVRRARRRLGGAGLARPGPARRPSSSPSSGPGRGTLMRDALRAATTVPGFRDAAAVWLVETSPALRARQAATLGGRGRRAGPARSRRCRRRRSVVIANEFLDALPIRQFQRADALWRERLVGIEGDGLGFVWGAPRPDAGLDARFPLLADGADRRGERRPPRRSPRRSAPGSRGRAARRSSSTTAPGTEAATRCRRWPGTRRPIRWRRRARPT